MELRLYTVSLIFLAPNPFGLYEQMQSYEKTTDCTSVVAMEPTKGEKFCGAASSDVVAFEFGKRDRTSLIHDSHMWENQS